MAYREEDVARTLSEAEKMVASIQEQLVAGDELYRQNGIDRDALLGSMSAKDKENADRIFAEDMAAVQREVAVEKSRLARKGP